MDSKREQISGDTARGHEEIELIYDKCKFRDKGIILNAPGAIEKQWLEFGFTNELKPETPGENTLVFVNNKAEFEAFLEQQLPNIVRDSVLWFAYPKGTSKIKTDIHRDILWALAKPYGIRAVTAISIDTTWSGLRFRPIALVGKK
jgi:hypothetical protein